MTQVSRFHNSHVSKMLIHGPPPAPPFYTTGSLTHKSATTKRITGGRRVCNIAISFLAAAAVVPFTATDRMAAAEEESETLSNIPQTLSGECAAAKDCKKGRIQKPKSRKAESCTSKCVTTCIRGGDGSPGEGPLDIRRPIVVFKQGFRSRQYCLVECSDTCNLIGDEEEIGP